MYRRQLGLVPCALAAAAASLLLLMMLIGAMAQMEEVLNVVSAVAGRAGVVGVVVVAVEEGGELKVLVPNLTTNFVVVFGGDMVLALLFAGEVFFAT